MLEYLLNRRDEVTHAEMSIKQSLPSRKEICISYNHQQLKCFHAFANNLFFPCNKSLSYFCFSFTINNDYNLCHISIVNVDLNFMS